MELINDIPGVSCVKPRGALYMSRKSTPNALIFTTIRKWCWIPVAGKSSVGARDGIQLAVADHFRIVTLPRVDDIELSLSKSRVSFLVIISCNLNFTAGD